MRHRRTLLVTAVLTTALTAGCASAGTSGRSADAAPAPAVSASPTATAASPAAASPAASSAPADAAGALPEGYDPSRNAAADIKAALALSAADHRPVLIDFGADWCPDCKVLGKLFQSDQVAPMLRSDYRVVTVDVGKFDHNLDVAAQYVDLRTSGIPALVVLAPDGSVRTASNDGAFSNARTMSAGTLAAYLKRWSQK